MGDKRQGSRCLLPEKAQPRDGGFELGRGFRYHARHETRLRQDPFCAEPHRSAPPRQCAHSAVQRALCAPRRPPRYAGTCARLSAEERQKRLDKGIPPTLRFRVENGAVVQFNDLVRGPQAYLTDDIGDFVIRRAEGSAAFFFSNAIDDALMEVTHVLRGEDHLSNTPRQILLQQALGLSTPHYGHISMIVGDDGAPLSKRTGSRSVRELREAGYLPLAVVNYLACLGHHYENNAYLDMDGLAREFDVAKLGRAPARYDATQLDYWQRQAVQHADAETLWHWMGEAVQAIVPAAQRDAFVAAVRGNVLFPGDALRWARVIYTETLELQGA